MASKLDLDCYLFDTWKPRIRPAPRRRAWMDATPESFAYRCLPLAIANAHGWEIGNGVGFSARWLGGTGVEDVEIRLDGEAAPIDAPASMFGQGVITFHIAGLFRTSPGWNLWIGGPPNHAKDGIAALSGIIETDWSPYSFTMNWRFTRPNHWVRFEADEPIGFFLPVERGVIDSVEPRFRPIAEAPELERQFRTWSRSRDAFQTQVAAHPPALPADKWQKLYYRGVDAEGAPGAADHQSKIRSKPFTPPLPETTPPTGCPAHAPPADDLRAANAARQLRRLQELRALSPRLRTVQRLRAIGPKRFLDDHYAANWPLVLAPGGAPADMPPWLGEELTRMAGSAAGAVFAEEAAPNGNWESRFAPVAALLAQARASGQVRLLRGAAGASAPIAEQVSNRLLVQVAGRVRVVLVPPAEALWLQGEGVHDLLDPGTPSHVPGTRDPAVFDIVLAPGEILFLPIGWWAQRRALETCIGLATTGFRWRNEFDDC